MTSQDRYNGRNRVQASHPSSQLHADQLAGTTNSVQTVPVRRTKRYFDNINLGFVIFFNFFLYLNV